MHCITPRIMFSKSPTKAGWAFQIVLALKNRQFLSKTTRIILVLV